MATEYLPQMTSNVAPAPFAVTASSNVANAFLATNSSLTDFWEPATSGNSEYIQVDLGVAVQLTNIDVLCGSTGSPSAISISGSNNNSTFTSIQNFTGLVFVSGIHTSLVFSSLTVPYRYYRLTLTAQGGSPSNIQNLRFRRTSATQSKVPGVQSPIRHPLSYIRGNLGDINLLSSPKALTNYAKVLFKSDGAVVRPVIGQIFPRGYAVSKFDVVIHPTQATNIAAYTGVTGSFQVRQISGISGASPYAADLNAACGSPWQPTGTFCNAIYPNDQDVFWKSTAQNAATWSTGGVNGKGVLVLDMGLVSQFNSINVFQMFGDDKVTHIQFFTHASTSSTFPVHTDSGWVAIQPEQVVSAGAAGIGSYQAGNGSIVSLPTKYSFPTISSRYLKVHARNTGAYGGGGYCEIGGLKIFNI